MHVMVEPCTGTSLLVEERFWKDPSVQKIKVGKGLLVTNSMDIANEFKKRASELEKDLDSVSRTVGKSDVGLLNAVLRGIRRELQTVGQMCGMDDGGPTVDEPEYQSNEQYWD